MGYRVLLSKGFLQTSLTYPQIAIIAFLYKFQHGLAPLLPESIVFFNGGGQILLLLAYLLTGGYSFGYCSNHRTNTSHTRISRIPAVLFHQAACIVKRVLYPLAATFIISAVV